MPSGGYRPGAGRPKKSVSEKILEGNPGKRPIEVLDFEECEEISKEPPKWLSRKGKQVYYCSTFRTLSDFRLSHTDEVCRRSL